MVLLGHAWLVLVPTHPLHWPGPAAVIVFFVLSGFVIAYVTDGHDRTLADFTLNRLARLWSVTLPALGFGAVLFQFAGNSVFSPEPAGGGTLLRTGANALFLGQAWFLNMAPPLNGPFWSLNYEAWFYAIFGAWVYLPRRTRAPAAALLAMLAGPKIMLLMPCWLLGALVYRNIGRWRLSGKTATALWACSLVMAIILVKSAIGTRLHDAFQTEWPQTASPARIFRLSADRLCPGPSGGPELLCGGTRSSSDGSSCCHSAKPIRLLASFTLTIYLFHLPLLILFWDVLHAPAWMCATALVISIVGLGYLTEHRRRDLRSLLAFIAGRFSAGSRLASVDHAAAAVWAN